MNRFRPRSKTAVAALLWSVLTTPLTSLPLLQLADHPGTTIHRYTSALPYFATATLVGVVLVGLPIVGVLLGSTAMKRITASWSPIRGAGYAKTAMTLGVLSALCGAVLFANGLVH